MDGVDAAMIHTDGERMVAIGPTGFHPFTRAELRLLMGGAEVAVETDTARLRRPVDWPLAVRAAGATATDAHARAVEAMLKGADVPRPDVIGFHGQTLVHRPEEGFTLQVGAGARLAARVGVSVVDQFRLDDVAAGGQGAPLVPVFHASLARRMGGEGPVAFLNIGGVANVTYIDTASDALIAFDTGPGNALLNDWMAATRGAAFDEGGAAALSGRADTERVARWLEAPFFDMAPPKSLDRGTFKHVLDDMGALSAEDGAATLAAYTVEAVAAGLRWLPAPPRRWLICGGGRHNRAIAEGLTRRLNAVVEPVEAAGFDGDAMEAQAFAFLAVRSMRGLPLTYPTTTGVAHPMSGGRLHAV
jgi:anhydro-N-acetylmuramic acid kinase